MTVFNLPPGIKIINGPELAPLHVYESNPKYSAVIKHVY